MERHFYWIRMADVPQWIIATPVPASGGEFDEPWMFGEGRLLQHPGAMKTQVEHQGERRAFVFAGLESVPVVSEAVANVFRALASDDVQLFPVTLEGESGQYFVVNAGKTIDCIDEANCREVHLHDEDDPEPARRGAYRWIYGLRIVPAKTEGARVFRPKRFTHALIVSEEVKAALERVGNLGVYFERVTGPHEQLPPPREVPAPLKQAREARAAAYGKLGDLSEDVIRRIVPTSGNWPSGFQAWRIIKRGQRTLFVSDGLSDPFLDASEPSVGFGFELAVETDEELPGDDGWPLDMLMWVSDGFANYADTRKLLETGLAFIQFSGKGMPEQLVVPPDVFKKFRPNDWVSEHGMSMALFGVEAPTLPTSFPTPAGPVRLVSAMAMHSSEIVAYLERGGDVVLPLFLKCAGIPLSSTKRKPVIQS
ncbi:imm11 family protein [Cystobacter fuscus]